MNFFGGRGVAARPPPPNGLDLVGLCPPLANPPETGGRQGIGLIKGERRRLPGLNQQPAALPGRIGQQDVALLCASGKEQSTEKQGEQFHAYLPSTLMAKLPGLPGRNSASGVVKCMASADWLTILPVVTETVPRLTTASKAPM